MFYGDEKAMEDWQKQQQLSVLKIKVERLEKENQTLRDEAEEREKAIENAKQIVANRKPVHWEAREAVDNL